ncbi:hypothetical protein ABEG10_23290 [Burkholderia cenocepacia]|uniref:hypothetical protein n=1 Tax=Burkholderia cenocepacia TaxID=95486 RepID=UPI0020A0563A|nr:hypothetical protein [Burkholderia cenocepacia]MCO8325933.1 hypothetical protein [Burkholderia cenocepacia]MCO8333003.1 hypothetical protein [Burkholderia cenocepacia]MCO8340503.1 hypothetical protein [Burkholderia cenocepacia]MCO8347789.1 hypothetical protein [Burkholderia cenocepacia]MCO8360855.1 hypothetical protein [Burkholderia cenocepacia]
MNQMTEPSTFKRPDWPLDALPQHWVEALFSKMAAFYGSRFASMWNGVNVSEVQRAWAIELGKLSRDQLKAGSDNLTALPKPPTLPEFVSLCRQARSEQAASTTPRLADERPADRATVEANLGAIRRVQERVMRREPTAEWAFKLLMRGKSASGAALPSEVVRCARDAIVSSAGFKVIGACQQPELRREYQTIRDAALGELTGEVQA